MTRTEMLLTGLSEEAGTKIAKSRDAQWFNEVQTALLEGSDIVKQAKNTLEQKTGESILDEHNRLSPRQQWLRKEAFEKKRLKSKRR
jgi:hypothetical protein